MNRDIQTIKENSSRFNSNYNLRECDRIKVLMQYIHQEKVKNYLPKDLKIKLNKLLKDAIHQTGTYLMRTFLKVYTY